MLRSELLGGSESVFSTTFFVVLLIYMIKCLLSHVRVHYYNIT